MTRPRLAAILALVLAALTLAATAYSVIANFPRGLILAALLVGAGVAAWYGLIRRGRGGSSASAWRRRSFSRRC